MKSTGFSLSVSTPTNIRANIGISAPGIVPHVYLIKVVHYYDEAYDSPDCIESLHTLFWLFFILNWSGNFLSNPVDGDISHL